MFNHCLVEINEEILHISPNKTIVDFGLQLPVINVASTSTEGSNQYLGDVNEIQQMENQLNAEQRVAYNIICNSVANDQHRIFFLDAPGGTGT